MSNIRIAVIGANQLDPDHHLALNQLSETERISAFVLDAASPEEAAATLNQARQGDALDAIILAEDQSKLRDWVTHILPYGWPVYCTHAVATTIEDMIEIRRAEQSARPAFLQFAATARHHESVIAALAKAESGEYGRLLTLRGVCGIPGTESEDQVTFGPGAQLIDLMHAFAGPFQDVSGFSDLDRTPMPGSEINVMASLRTHSGTLANLHLSATQWRPTFRLELGFERGYMWLEGLNSERYNFGEEAFIYARTDGANNRHETVDRFQHSNGTKAALEAFLARIDGQSAPAAGSSQNAFETLNTLQRILAADPIIAPLQERHVS